MNRFFSILLVILIISFIIQQSHMIQKETKMDPVLRVPKDEYHVHMENLTDYISRIPQKTGDWLNKVSKTIQRWTSSHKSDP